MLFMYYVAKIISLVRRHFSSFQMKYLTDSMKFQQKQVFNCIF